MSAPFKLALEALIPPQPCRYSADQQALIHRACGIDVSEPWRDPFLAFMGGVYAVGEAITAQLPTWGAVIARQAVSIKARHPIDAPAITHGRVTEFAANARGYSLGISLEAANPAGKPFAEALMTLFLFDPGAAPGERKQDAPGLESATPPRLDPLGMYSFTPEAVRCFEFDRPPSPHTDLDVARSAGFPKPIVAGNQVFSIIWNRFVSPGFALPVDMNFTLKHPIFWDETITFEKRSGDAPGRETLEVRNAFGKTAIVCALSGNGSLAQVVAR